MLLKCYALSSPQRNNGHFRFDCLERKRKKKEHANMPGKERKKEKRKKEKRMKERKKESMIILRLGESYLV